MSMNLIHLVPDTVLQWIGAQSQSASAGSQAGQDFTRSTAGAMAAGGQMASQAGQALKGKRAQDKANKDREEGLARPKMNSDGSVSTANEDAEKHARNGNKATLPTVDITPKAGSVRSD